MSKKLVYLAGDMLNKGAQMQRAMERDAILALGYDIYNPSDNKEINDKKNVVQEGLAERIVRHDTDALMNADICIFEPLAHATGTCMEMAQIKGAKDMAQKIFDTIMKTQYEPLEVQLKEVIDICIRMLGKEVYTHNSDIRRHDIPEVGDRRSFAPHQYMHGVNLDLTDGVGFREWEEILDILGGKK
jgi:nucleoside 2-deoxyribosyltransferase